mmetsp:Transcript_120675/g.301077  ORF Transcript_120675/g.301077 Transcript_120675/m.301077 type:complete len:278 (+) Transcript_120675:287-1120(+)
MLAPNRDWLQRCRHMGIWLQDVLENFEVASCLTWQVDNCEFHNLEAAPKKGEKLLEHVCNLARMICEGPAAKGTQYNMVVSLTRCRLQKAADVAHRHPKALLREPALLAPFLHDSEDFLLAATASPPVVGGDRNHIQDEGLFQQWPTFMLRAAEGHHILGEYRGELLERVWHGTGAVSWVQALRESCAAKEILLLSPAAFSVPTTRSITIRHVENQHPPLDSVDDLLRGRERVQRGHSDNRLFVAYRTWPREACALPARLHWGGWLLDLNRRHLFPM